MKPIPETPDITIQKIVPNGLGMGFSGKQTIFVPLAATGDRVRVRITERKKKVAFAEIVEVLQKSPERTDPACKYYGICGGCDFQHLNYTTQLETKVSLISDCLSRLGHIKDHPEIRIIPSPESFGYRARTQWQTDKQTNTIGYFGRGSHDVIDIDHCPILTDTLQQELARLRDNLDISVQPGKNSIIEAAENNSGTVSVYSRSLIEEVQELTFSAVSETYFYDAKSFFQGNPFLIGDLIELATSNTRGEAALDLFCGVGLFSLPLARRFNKVTGVENNSNSIEFAKKAALNTGLEHLDFYCMPAAEFIEGIKPRTYDFILLDPPRSGVDVSIIESIARLKPQEIAYVSCEPSVLARDLKMLIEHNYCIRAITALDMFPQTHHVETVVRLRHLSELA